MVTKTILVVSGELGFCGANIGGIIPNTYFCGHVMINDEPWNVRCLNSVVNSIPRTEIKMRVENGTIVVIVLR